MKDDKLEIISNLFEGKEIRSIWDAEKEEYYLSVVDVIGALTESKDSKDYWYRLKKRMTEEEKSEISTKCRQLKLKSTDVWKENGITKNYEYAVLTNEIYQEWSGMKASEYKDYKNIRKESLRDNMTDVEVALANLGEIATRELAKEHKPYGLKANKEIAKKGGHVAKVAREDMEKELGKSVVSKENALNYQYINDNKLTKKNQVSKKNTKKLKENNSMEENNE